MSIRTALSRHPHVIGYTLVALVATTGTASAAGHLHIHSADIVNGQVKTKDLADGSVTSAKLGDGSVTSAKLGDGSVTTAKLGANSVTSAKVGDDTLTGADILESSLTNVANSQQLGGLSASAFGRAPRLLFDDGTATAIQPSECLDLFAFGVGAAGDAGKVVTGYITDQGGVNPPPDINNATLFLPGTVFKTSQGGTIGFVQVCNPTTQVKNLPTGWMLITSVKS